MVQTRVGNRGRRVNNLSAPFSLANMKRFFSSADTSIGFLASANLAAAGAARALDSFEHFVGWLQNIIQFFVPLGQVAVAAATVYYILRKAKTVKIAAGKRKSRKK